MKKVLVSMLIMAASIQSLFASTVTLEGVMTCTLHPYSASSSSSSSEPAYTEECADGTAWDSALQTCVEACDDGKFLLDGQCLAADVYYCVTDPGKWWSPDLGSCQDLPTGMTTGVAEKLSVFTE